MIRAFIALDLSAQVLNGLDQACRMLKQQLPDSPVRWVVTKNIHLTLKFLGDVSEINLTALFEMLNREGERHAPFEVRVGGLGAFPSLHRPRVIWIGVAAPPELAILQRCIDQESGRLGYQSEERDFSPHLTLGRVARSSSPDAVNSLGDALARLKIGELGTCRIDGIHFYRSDLNPHGSVYTKLWSARLTGKLRSQDQS
jgi:2'-5' RNA ligase